MSSGTRVQTRSSTAQTITSKTTRESAERTRCSKWERKWIKVGDLQLLRWIPCLCPSLLLLVSLGPSLTSPAADHSAHKKKKGFAFQLSEPSSPTMNDNVPVTRSATATIRKNTSMQVCCSPPSSLLLFPLLFLTTREGRR